MTRVVRRQRKWAPKTRNGCRTCKIRKKRCDQTRPRCLRCVEGQYVCEGYDTDESVDPRKSTEKVFIYPSPTTSSLEEATTLTPSTNDSLLCSSPGLAIQDQYFWSHANLSQSFTQYFLDKVVPAFCTTEQWHYFWESLIPQTATRFPSIHHAMIALTATFESRVSGVSRSALVLEQSDLAARSFASMPTTPEIGLAICRLFVTMARLTEDWELAAMHMNSGRKICLEAALSGKARSELVTLMAPTMTTLVADFGSDVQMLDSLPLSKRQALTSLLVYPFEFQRLFHLHWHAYDELTSGFLSICWSTMTQALASVSFPDIIFFDSSHPITPASRIRVDLLATERLLSLDELKVGFEDAFKSFDDHFGGGKKGEILPHALKMSLTTLVENLVVQAAAIEPRMTAGTFWYEGPGRGCTFESHLKPSRDECQEDRERALEKRCKGVMKRRAYYLEHVCHYRSGLMPAVKPRQR